MKNLHRNCYSEKALSDYCLAFVTFTANNSLTCVLKSEITINFFRIFLGKIYVKPVSLMSSEET